MKKLFKVIAALLLLLLLVVAALIFTFDPNNYKDHIVELVEQQTGRDFKIDGDINYSLFPWLGLELEQVALGNAQGFSERAFAEIKQLDVKVMALPLLKKEVQVDKIRLHGLAASLEVNSQGENNWSDLSQTDSKADAISDSKTVKTDVPVQPAASGGEALAGLVVNGVEFVDASIRWSDEQTGALASIADLSLETSAIRFNEPVDVEFNAHVSSNQPEMDAKVSLHTKVKFNRELNVYDVDGLEVNVQTLMQSISKEMIVLDVRTSAHIDLKQQAVSLKSLEVGIPGVVLSANLDITQLDSEPKIKGSIATNVINGRDLAKALQIELPPMANEASLTAVSMRSDIEFSQGNVSLDGLMIGLDKTQITGWVHVPGIAQPEIDYSLTMSSINLDDYMAPVSPATDKEEKSANKASEANVNKQAADVEIKLPLELLRSLGLNGLFKIEKATIQDIAITDISIKTLAQNGQISISPVTMNLLDGRVDMGVGLNVIQVPEYTVTLNAKDMRVGQIADPIIKNLSADENIKLEGVAWFVADIKASGASLMQLKKSATGDISFDMNQTSLTGVDVEHLVLGDASETLENNKEILSLFDRFGFSIPEKWTDGYTPEDKTAFKKMHASAVVKNGKLKNNDFIMDSSRIKVTGKGEIDIVKNTMDYYALVNVNRDKNKTLKDKIKNQPMGYRIYGPLTQPEWNFDKSRWVKTTTKLAEEEFKRKARKKIDDKKKETKKKAKKELEDKLRDKLKGLFK